MRNPISVTQDRPIPLPDCILMDGWWVEHALRERERKSPLSGGLNRTADEGKIERYQRDSD